DQVVAREEQVLGAASQEIERQVEKLLLRRDGTRGRPVFRARDDLSRLQHLSVQKQMRVCRHNDQLLLSGDLHEEIPQSLLKAGLKGEFRLIDEDRRKIVVRKRSENRHDRAQA